LIFENDLTDKLFELSDFIPGRNSEFSNNLEILDFKKNEKDEEVIKRDFNNTINKKAPTDANNNKKNPRLTIDLIARDMGLIESNDEIDYSAIGDINFNNNFNLEKLNNIKNNPFAEDIINFNNQLTITDNFKRDVKYLKENDLKNIDIINEQNNKNSSNTNNNNNLNRVTILGPLVNCDIKDSSSDTSFLFENNNKFFNDKTKNNLNFHNNFSKVISDPNQKKNENLLLNNNNQKNLKINTDNKVNEVDKNNTNNIIKQSNTNNILIKNPHSISNLNNAFANDGKNDNLNKNNKLELFKTELSPEKIKKSAFLKGNKIFDSINKNESKKIVNKSKNYDNIEDIANNNKEKMNTKNNFSNKVTIGLSDLLKIDSIDGTSEINSSRRTSEKNNNKFAKKRKSIKRNTLNFLKQKDFTQISISSEDEKQNHVELKKDEILDPEIENEEKFIKRDINGKNIIQDKMNVCDDKLQIKPEGNNNAQIKQEKILNEAEEILKNLENNIYNNNDNKKNYQEEKKKNFNLKDANFNPFLTAVKEKKNITDKYKEKEVDNYLLITPNILNNINDDYLLATPGKFFISNNSSNIKEKPFSKFTGYKPDFNITSKNLQNINQEIKINVNKDSNDFINNNNISNKNPFDIVNNKIIKTSNNTNIGLNSALQKNNDLNFKNLNNRITIDKLVDLNVEETETPLTFSDEEKGPMKKEQVETEKNKELDKDLEIKLENLNINNYNKKNQIDLFQNIVNNDGQEYYINQSNNSLNNSKENNMDIYEKKEEKIINDFKEEDKVNENISFSQFASESIFEFDLNEEFSKADIDIKFILNKTRERNDKLIEYMKEIFKSRFSKMKNSEKAFKEKVEYLNNIRNQIENYKKETDILEKEILLIDTKEVFFTYFNNFFKFITRDLLNTKVLGIEFNSLKFIFANTINISFIFEDLNHGILHNPNFDKDIMDAFRDFDDNDIENYSSERIIFEKIKMSKSHKEALQIKKFMLKEINFFFISNFLDEIRFKDKLLEETEVNIIFRKIITYILNNIFTNKSQKFYPLTIFEFLESYKIFINAATNIVHLIKQFYLWDSLFNNVLLQFDEANETLIMNFTINYTGFILILTFTCDILDAFFGYDFTNYQIVKNILPENELIIEREKIDKICDNIKSFLESKQKLYNPYFFISFIQNMKNKIVEK